MGYFRPMNLKSPLLRIVLLFALSGFALSIASADTPKEKAAKKRQPHPSLAAVEEVAGLPRVLLIGDSISMGYTLPVREHLAGKANVVRPPMNCGSTQTGLEKIDAWLATGVADRKWDLIHFNWGLHDFKYVLPDGRTLADPSVPGSKQVTGPEEYRKNLETLVAKLKGTGAKLVWRNTTPVPEGSTGRLPADAVRYNAIAAEVMDAAGIPIHDLFGFSEARLGEIQLPQNVHFSTEGSEVLAGDVVRVILEKLGS